MLDVLYQSNLKMAFRGKEGNCAEVARRNNIRAELICYTFENRFEAPLFANIYALCYVLLQ